MAVVGAFVPCSNRERNLEQRHDVKYETFFLIMFALAECRGCCVAKAEA